MQVLKFDQAKYLQNSLKSHTVPKHLSVSISRLVSVWRRTTLTMYGDTLPHLP